MPAPKIEHCGDRSIAHDEHLWEDPNDSSLEGGAVRWCVGTPIIPNKDLGVVVPVMGEIEETEETEVSNRTNDCICPLGVIRDDCPAHNCLRETDPGWFASTAPEPDEVPLVYNGEPLFDEEGMTPEQLRRARRLARWWMADAARDCAKMVPKAIRYGSADLKLMGLAMQLLHPGIPVQGEELAVWYYSLGKVARLLGGYAQGEEPDDDSWYDLKIYSMMAKYVRETGEW